MTIINKQKLLSVNCQKFVQYTLDCLNNKPLPYISLDIHIHVNIFLKYLLWSLNLLKVLLSSYIQEAYQYYLATYRYTEDLRSILKSLRRKIGKIVRSEIGSANEQQGLGYAVLILVLIISPCIIFLVRNATLTIQVFSLNLAKKAHELKVEKRKADKLLFQASVCQKKEI